MRKTAIVAGALSATALLGATPAVARPPSGPTGQISSIQPSPMHSSYVAAYNAWWCGYGPVAVSYVDASAPVEVQVVPYADGSPVFSGNISASGQKGSRTVNVGDSISEPGAPSPAQDVSLHVTLMVKSRGSLVTVDSSEIDVGSCILP